MHTHQNTPPWEEVQVPEPAKAPAQPDSLPICEDSLLTSIAEAPTSVESEQIEERLLTDENASSDWYCLSQHAVVWGQFVAS